MNKEKLKNKVKKFREKSVKKFFFMLTNLTKILYSTIIRLQILEENTGGRGVKFLKIKAKLFGLGEIYVDGKKVKFSYSKIEGFIYYMLIQKTVSRSEMAGLLWPEDSEKTAKKNLRNVLYHTRKTIGKDFILSPNNTILQLNEAIDIQTDLEDFLKDPKGKSYLYQGDFLQGFNLRDSEEYERWVHNKRSQYFESYYRNLQEKASQDLESRDLTSVEADLQRLIDLDNLDEENYRLLMTYYLLNKRYKKTIELYSDLDALLKRELGVDPRQEIKDLYGEALEKLNTDHRKTSQDPYLYVAREKELAQIHQLISAFKNRGEIKALYLEGEAGIGKSALLKRAYLDFSSEVEIYTIPCYEFEEGRPLNATKTFLEKLEPIKGQGLDKLLKTLREVQEAASKGEELETNLLALEDDLEDLIKILDDGVFRIFNFEDVHWIDKYSARLLTRLILKAPSQSMYFFSARLGPKAYIEDMVASLDKYGLLEKIKLEPLTYEEGEKYVRKLMGPAFNEEAFKNIYDQAQGNPLFMEVFSSQAIEGKEIGYLNERLVRDLRSRITFLKEEEQKLLRILSFFKEPFPIDIIFKLTDLDQEVIVNLLDKLEKRNILYEREVEGSLYYDFSYKKIKEYVYLDSNKARRKVYHKKIADLLEENPRAYKNKLKYLEELSYHFGQGDNQAKEVTYEIEILDYYLSYSQDLYPVFEDIDFNDGEKIYIRSQLIKERLNKLKEKLDQLEKGGYSKLEDLKIKYFYIRGRYLIRTGTYDEGLADITYVLNKAKALGDLAYMIGAYKQLIYYKIQVNDRSNMKVYIEAGLNLSAQANYHKEISMFLRFKGLYYLMEGAYDQAERLLRDSINTLSVTEEIASQYATNIAAAYAYLGEISLARGDYPRAQEEFIRAIDLSREKNVQSSLAVFYINIGRTLYYQKDLEKSKFYLSKAQEIFETYDFYWKRSVLYSYLTLIAFEEDDQDQASKYLKEALQADEKIKDPRAKGALNFVLYTIDKSISQGQREDYFKDLLKEEPRTYRDLALDNLDPYRDIYERDLVK